MPKDLRDGASVHWIELGDESGAPALALHCALAHSGAWGGLAKALGGRLSIIAPDMPGHGQSADWDGPESGDFHDNVTGIAETFLEDGMTLIGHSFGATVALRLAETHPDKIRRVVLIEPVLFAAARESAPKLFAERREAARPMMEALEHDDPETAARAFTGTWGVGRSWHDMNDRARRQIMRQMRIVQNTETALTWDGAGLLHDGRLEGCTMPVLFVRGEQTEPILAEIHATLMSRLPDAREAMIEGAGHMSPITAPDAVGQTIAAFLDES
ncbi:alpha/beta fold hydrolase [Roseivivax sp. THAF30]|uniref:alpha/beta fold hydrolase n=1 Tax=Roseivivax sp. THAF30 TaxID=2587852 RepID=UPI0012681A13|nr:alpha/beta hydrolase [Roseivivax sp. THAF30]QFT61704.1 Tropinesterase [Roseivivax sp. THAF30]